MLNRNRVFPGKTAKAETGVVIFGRAKSLQKAVNRYKSQAVGAKRFAKFLRAGGIADEIFAVRSINTEITGEADRRRANSDMYFLRARCL